VETGVRLGTHHWDEEVLREARGEFLFAHVSTKVVCSASTEKKKKTQLSDLRKMMYDIAIGQGATIRLNTTAVALDPEQRTVTLDSGKILTADVIIGADGVFGLMRPLLLAEQNIQEAKEPVMCMYR
jgi:salicylate hydroxylase